MANDDQKRYDDALASLKSVNQGIGNEVDGLIHNKAAVGKELSLKGRGFWHSGSDEQHKLVRAYLLCLIAYGRPTYAKSILATTAKLDEARRELHGKTAQFVREQIGNFVAPRQDANLVKLATVARQALSLSGNDDPLTRKRTDMNVGSHIPICYNGVRNWLFGAGFVSRRWLIKEGLSLDANTCNRLLGDGEVVDKSDWGNIPAGYFWNIHKQGDQTTCHWGVSLGNDEAAACNNTAGTLIDGTLFMLDFSTGTSASGICKFTDLCKVCDNDEKYTPSGRARHESGTNIVVRKINPTLVRNFY